MGDYIRVCEAETDEDLELPLEEDNTLLLTTLTAQFPGACGLKYRNPSSGSMRGVRLSDSRFHSPSTDGWDQDTIFVCVFPKENKRKSEDALENSSSKTKRKTVENRKCTDLIVLGLPYKTDETKLREYFSQFGELVMSQIKTNLENGKSKGFGFIRYVKYECQLKALADRHNIDGRWCDVRIPASRHDGTASPDICRKIFVGRLTKDITEKDLQDYFGQYGDVLSIVTPKPFRGFSFVTFLDPDVAEGLCGEDHIINNVSVHVSSAIPKPDKFNHGLSVRGGRYDERDSWNDCGRRSPGGGYWGDSRGGSNDYYNDGDFRRSNWSDRNERRISSRARSGNDMPNMAPLGSSLGINPSSGSSGGNGGPNMNIPLTPALVAAALNQASWGLLNNMQGGDGGGKSNYGNQSGSGGPSSGSHGGSGGGSWMKNYHGMSP